jgi:hypothetical protein
MQAWAGNKTGFHLGVFTMRFSNHLHPFDVPPFLCLLLSDEGDIIFRLAGNYAGLTSGAPVQIDHHPPQMHLSLFLARI